jgi:hypothetical protein
MSPFLIHIYSVGNIETTNWVKSYSVGHGYLLSKFISKSARENKEYIQRFQSLLGEIMSKAQPHPGHEKHLCKLVEDKTPTEKLKPLVKNSKYICKGCGRTAAKAENLCAPELI